MRLVITGGGKIGRSFNVTKAAATIGRVQVCDIVLDDPSVSPLHARIERAGGTFLLRDQGSENGTYVNERLITEPHPLAYGEVIRVGVFTLRVEPTPAGSESAPMTRIGRSLLLGAGLGAVILIIVWGVLFGRGNLLPTAYQPPSPTYQLPSPTYTLSPIHPTETRAPSPTLTTAPTATDTPTPGPKCKFGATFMSDVSYSDGAEVQPGTAFQKIWRVKNTGTCAWDRTFVLNFISGHRMNGDPVALTPTAPNATTNIVVSFTAPSACGTYRSAWRLRTPDGALFGSTLTVMIKVACPTPPTAIVTATATATTLPGGCSGAPNVPLFTATETKITLGTWTTLKWDLVTNADAVYIDNGVGEEGVATPGDAVVSPAVTTTYTLTAYCTRTKSTTIKQVTVNVLGSVHASGIATLPLDSCFDLDDGNDTGCSAASVDLRWKSVGDARHRELDPVHGAKLSLFGSATWDDVTLADCKGLAYSDAGIPANAEGAGPNNLPVGTMVCAKTSSSRFAKFRIRSIASDGTLQIRWLSWE
jgi:hypothetical protein